MSWLMQVPNVEVPEDYIEDGQIILDMTPSAIIDLEMGNEHVEFKADSGVTRHIILPMSAILALYAYENGRGMVLLMKKMTIYHLMATTIMVSQQAVSHICVSSSSSINGF